MPPSSGSSTTSGVRRHVERLRGSGALDQARIEEADYRAAGAETDLALPFPQLGSRAIIIERSRRIASRSIPTADRRTMVRLSFHNVSK